MPECLPFCGWLYNLSKVNPEEVLAPPYDVVTPEEIELYKNKSPYNIFHLELPESEKSARALLESFIREGIFLQNSSPSLYYHELSFQYQGKSYLRKGLILLVKLHPFEEGKILPHEKVYPKVTENRLELLKATHFQFSQIYGLYEDPELFTLKSLPEEIPFYLEVNHLSETQRLAKIKDRHTIQRIISYLKDQRIYIADGHHRYTTALKYKAHMEGLLGKDERRDYNYISMYLSPFEDENLLMLPTHRVYRLSEVEGFIKKMSDLVNLKEISLKEGLSRLTERGSKGNSFFLTWRERLWYGELKEAFFKELKEREPELAELPLFNFLKVLEEILGENEESLKEESRVEFLADAEEVLRRAGEGHLGVIFPLVSPQVLKKVALKGKVMPHKSTYFYPKILTGLVLAEVSGKRVK